MRQDRGVGPGRQHGLQQQLGLGLRDHARRSASAYSARPMPPGARLSRSQQRSSHASTGSSVDHGLAEQLVLRPHGRPHHVAEGVHVLAALDAQADGVGQRLVDEALGDLAHRIEHLALARSRARRPAPPHRARRRPQLRQHLRGQHLADRLAHVGVARRIVGQQDLGAQRLRVVPGARLRGEGLPVLQPRQHVGVPRDHHGAVGQPHHRREFAQRVIDGARIAHRVVAEQIDLVVRNGLAHGASLLSAASSSFQASPWRTM